MIDSAHGKNTHAHPFGKRGYGKKKDSRVCVLCKPEAFIYEDDVKKAYGYRQELSLISLSHSNWESSSSVASTSKSKSKSTPEVQYQYFSLKLQRILSSEYRFRHKLTQKQMESIDKDQAAGLKRIRKRVQTQLRKRLKFFDPQRDGTQSPFRTHFTDPVFHSLALCCRSCVEQWHMIPRRSVISEAQLELMEDFFLFFIAQLTITATKQNGKWKESKDNGKKRVKSENSLPLRAFMMAEYSSAKSDDSDPKYSNQRYDSSEWLVFENESQCFRAKKVGPGIKFQVDTCKTPRNVRQTALSHSVIDLTSGEIETSSPGKKMKVENESIGRIYMFTNQNELQFQQDLQRAIAVSLKREK